MKEYYHYIIISITLCRCAAYSNEVELRQVEHPSNKMTIMFSKMSAKQFDTLQLRKGVFYYKDSVLISQIQNFQP